MLPTSTGKYQSHKLVVTSKGGIALWNVKRLKPNGDQHLWQAARSPLGWKCLLQAPFGFIRWSEVTVNNF